MSKDKKIRSIRNSHSIGVIGFNTMNKLKRSQLFQQDQIVIDQITDSKYFQDQIELQTGQHQDIRNIGLHHSTMYSSSLSSSINSTNLHSSTIQPSIPSITINNSQNICSHSSHKQPNQQKITMNNNKKHNNNWNKLFKLTKRLQSMLPTPWNHNNQLSEENDKTTEQTTQKLDNSKPQLNSPININIDSPKMNNFDFDNINIDINPKFNNQTLNNKSDKQLNNNDNQPQLDTNLLNSIFGECQSQKSYRISQQSSYNHLPGYKLLHLIVKPNDDLRQQNFAMQLLEQLSIIFQMQSLPIKLLPYQVLPLSHNAGIVQCITDAVTISQLLKKGGTLNFIKQSSHTLHNFISTLSGYSLATYLLQVKDRHNGNIMITRDGKLFHIDYGFFLSNAPGKGVEIEKNLPFKLTNQYIQALGGLKSKQFLQFRLLFYQGYNACRKHQHRILILTKLMYSSFGRTMRCFSKGDMAINGLEERFNPPGVSTDAELSLYCQKLIDASIDNWRSRWYDKIQYCLQGILY